MSRCWCVRVASRFQSLSLDACARSYLRRRHNREPRRPTFDSSSLPEVRPALLPGEFVCSSHSCLTGECLVRTHHQSHGVRVRYDCKQRGVASRLNFPKSVFIGWREEKTGEQTTPPLLLTMSGSEASRASHGEFRMSFGYLYTPFAFGALYRTSRSSFSLC